MGHHINAKGEFQSDKYPELSPDKIVVTFKHRQAWPALALVAAAYAPTDAELANDIATRLETLGAEWLPRMPPDVAQAGAVDVILERCRQVTAERFSPEHDDEHCGGELATAAACYAIAAGAPGEDRTNQLDTPPVLWPWDWKWWKPKDRRRDLVRAAALILAEIERLDRAALRGR